MISKLTFKAEHNCVVAYRERGRVSVGHIETTNENRELERLCHWAYELGRRDRHWELEKFLSGQGTHPIKEVI